MAGTRTRDWAEIDFYRVLGVPADASEDDIGRAYRTLAKQLHPDAGAQPEQAERFKDVTAAYSVLSNARIRRDYDMVRAHVSVPPIVEHVIPAPVTVSRPTGAFRAAKPPKGWTRPRAWISVIGGTLVTLLGVFVAIVVVDLRTRAGDPGVQSDAARDITLAIVALKLLIGGPVFVALGVLHLTHRPMPKLVSSLSSNR
jgi:DnaJ domain